MSTAGPSQIGALTPVERDLLLATGGEGDAAVAAWCSWRDSIDWDGHLDSDAFRLLPLTSRRLRERGIDDALFPRINGIARQAWYANQRRLAEMRPLLRAFAEEEIVPLVLPPTASLLFDAATVQEDTTPLRLAVQREHADAAIRTLARLGWRTAARLPLWSLGGYSLAADRLAWRDAAGRIVEFSWPMEIGDAAARLGSAVWARAHPARLANEAVLAPDPTDLLVELCWRPVATDAFAALVTLLLLVAALPQAPDWRRFAGEAAQSPDALAWRDLFALAHETCPQLVPAVALAPSPPAARAFAAHAATPVGNMRMRMAWHWSIYQRAWGARYSPGAALRHLPGYLIAHWNLPAMRYLPRRIWRGFRHEWRDAHRSR